MRQRLSGAGGPGVELGASPLVIQYNPALFESLAKALRHWVGSRSNMRPYTDRPLYDVCRRSFVSQGAAGKTGDTS